MKIGDFSQSFKARPKLVLAFVAALVLLVAAGTIYYVRFYSPIVDCTQATDTVRESAELAKLPVISKEELVLHDGIKKQTLYVGFDCLVYDVTSAKASYYGEGKPYHYLVGKDATAQLQIFGGGIVKRKYKAVGILGN